jgi:hypothetical protein
MAFVGIEYLHNVPFGTGARGEQFEDILAWLKQRLSDLNWLIHGKDSLLIPFVSPRADAEQARGKNGTPRHGNRLPRVDEQMQSHFEKRSFPYVAEGPSGPGPKQPYATMKGIRAANR